MAFSLGSFVTITGLEKAPVYNGVVGLVVKEANKNEEKEEARYGIQLLDHAEGWKEEKQSSSPQTKSSLAVGGKIIAVKQVNLKKTNRDSLHWRIAASGDISILERVRMDPQLANLDRCDEFAQGLWNCFFETIPGMPLMLDDGLHMRRSIVKDAKGHKIYWLAMDAIQHQFIIEKCRGRYRIFQAFVDEAPVMPGYTAKEWCGMQQPRLLETSVHKTYGGGRTVGDKEINLLFDYIKELQSVSNKLLPHLLKHVPGLVQSDIDLIKGDPSRLSQEEMDLAQEKLQKAIVWSNEIEHLMEGPLGLTTLNVIFDYPENIKVRDDLVYIVQGDNEVFRIPKRLYLRVHDLTYKLTGQTMLSPVTFVRMINSGAWWEHRSDADGGAVGFTIRQAALDEVQSYEEGLDAARKKTAYVQNMR